MANPQDIILRGQPTSQSAGRHDIILGPSYPTELGPDSPTGPDVRPYRQNKARLWQRATMIAIGLAFVQAVDTPDIAAEPETVIQDIQGTRALRAYQTKYNRSFQIAATLGWTTAEDFSDPNIVTTELYIQPIVGTTKLAQSNQSYRSTALKAAQYGWFTPEDFESGTEPWTQLVQGTSALARGNRQFTLRSHIAANYGWFTPQDGSDPNFVTTELYIQPTVGTKQWQYNANKNHNQAGIAAHYGWFTPEDFDAPLVEIHGLQDVQGTLELALKQRAFWRRSIVASGYGWFAPQDNSDPNFVTTELYIQQIVGTRAFSTSIAKTRAQSIIASRYGVFAPTDTAVVVETDTWTQPVQGTQSLSTTQKIYRGRALKASFGWFAPQDFETGTEPWTQPVQGTTQWARNNQAFTHRSLIASTLFWSDSYDSIIEESTWTQPIQGTSSLKTTAKLQWQRAIIAARLTWFAPQDNTSLPTQPDLYIQPVQGTRSLATAARTFSKRAIYASSFGRAIVQDFSESRIQDLVTTTFQINRNVITEFQICRIVSEDLGIARQITDELPIGKTRTGTEFQIRTKVIGTEEL